METTLQALLSSGTSVDPILEAGSRARAALFATFSPIHPRFPSSCRGRYRGKNYEVYATRSMSFFARKTSPLFQITERFLYHRNRFFFVHATDMYLEIFIYVFFYFTFILIKYTFNDKILIKIGGIYFYQHI